MSENCNGNIVANSLYTSLTAGIPESPMVDLTSDKYKHNKDLNSTLYEEPNVLKTSDLTECTIDGNGVFDVLMRAVDSHIEREFKGNRITGDQYADVYTKVMTAVLGQSTQFLLTKEQSKWAAITAQMEARIAEVKAIEAEVILEKTKAEAQKAVFDMQHSSAQYALTKINIANANAQYCLAEAQVESEKYKRDYILPAEYDIAKYQRSDVLPAEVEIKKVTYNRVLPSEAAIKEYQYSEILPVEKNIQKFQLNSQLPLALSMEQYKLNSQMPVQTKLLTEQMEAQRAQTLDMRSDGLTTIKGSIGKQKDLYSEQIQSFIKDAKHKTAKMYLDAWITQKTLDEGLAAPAELVNSEVSDVIASLRATNNM